MATWGQQDVNNKVASGLFVPAAASRLLQGKRKVFPSGKNRHGLWPRSLPFAVPQGIQKKGVFVHKVWYSRTSLMHTQKTCFGCQRLNHRLCFNILQSVFFVSFSSSPETNALGLWRRSGQETAGKGHTNGNSTDFRSSLCYTPLLEMAV